MTPIVNVFDQTKKTRRKDNIDFTNNGGGMSIFCPWVGVYKH